MVALPGVSAANASFSAGTLKVDYDPGRVLPGLIAEAIRAVGFSCNHGTPGETKEHMHGDHGSQEMQGSRVSYYVAVTPNQFGRFGCCRRNPITPSSMSAVGAASSPAL